MLSEVAAHLDVGIELCDQGGVRSGHDGVRVGMMKTSVPDISDSIEREIADDLQHGEAGLSVQRILGTKQTLVHQRRDTVQNRRRGVIGAHRFRCLQRESRGEHTQPCEQLALGVVEEIVAPGDGGT
jgi:hypothetical protein